MSLSLRPRLARHHQVVCPPSRTRRLLAGWGQPPLAVEVTVLDGCHRIAVCPGPGRLRCDFEAGFDLTGRARPVKRPAR